MSTTPTVALEVLLNIPPIQIYKQGEARSAVYRLLQGQSPIIGGHSTKHNKLYLEVRADNVLGLPTDSTTPKYCFVNHYRTQIPAREDWENGPPIKAEITWYDGSKTQEGVGAGIYEPRTKMKISIPMGKPATVFQAEITALEHCAREIKARKIRNKSLAIYTDSQATIKALQSNKITSKLVLDCHKALNEITSQNKVTLSWVPGHGGHKGNEGADDAAREGSSMRLIGPEPFCGVAKPVAKTAIMDWMDRESRRWWRDMPGQRQAKEFLRGPSANFTEDLLSYNRKAVRIMVGLRTGHCRRKRHLSLMEVEENTECRFCQEEEETTAHVLCHYEGLARVRFHLLGDIKPEAEREKEPLSKLLSLVRETNLDKAL
ncbi:uncharacterized protein LOC132696179 [Cylas formicarius]|uniref:uncharacterized protein LOC132696179 n=1 Tax=Cylas formicarius TaxID=197179 RepID=UPI002958C012|nr:uncharacterized protein LOC132696179 [Cylas formicarius]